VSSPSTDESWNAFLDRVHGDITQRPGWARAKGSSYESSLVTTSSADAVSAGALLLYRRVAPMVRIGYVPAGPLTEGADVGAANKIVDALKADARRLHLAALLVAPRHGDTHVESALKGAGFVFSPIGIAPAATVRIDLRPSLDEISSNLPRKRRKAIRKSEEMGVTVRRGTAADVEVLHKLHVESAESQHFTAQPLEYLMRQWNEFHPIGAMEIFVAELDGIAVASDLVTVTSEMVTGKIHGWSRTEHGRKADPNPVLHWTIVQWAREHGCTYYDLGGLRREFAEEILAGTKTVEDLGAYPDAYKLRFGGEPMLLPNTVAYCPNPLVRFALRKIGPLAVKPGWLNRQVTRLRS
jgi:peptidoglycan pentaglycine glycine transferase (the first glycine)